MKCKELSAGYVRVNQLMMGIMEAVENNDKATMLKLSKHVIEDISDFVGISLEHLGVSEDEMKDASPSDEDDEELLKTAGSADQIRTAKVK